MILISKIKDALYASLYASLWALLLANGIAVQALADDYYTYGSTAFNGFAAESYGSYVFAVGSDNNVHAWDVSIPAGADPNDRNYLGAGSAAPRTFNHLGSFSLGFANQSNQASLYVANNTLWYGSGQHVSLTDSTGASTNGLRAFNWEVSAGNLLVGTRDEKEDVIFDEDVTDNNEETVADSETLAYDEATDTWYIGTKDEKIFHLDGNNDWIEDTLDDILVTEQGGIEIVDGLLMIADKTDDFIAIYENLGDVAKPDWQIFDKNGDSSRDKDDVYTYTNSEAVSGLGYGQFDHLWVTSGEQLYELGTGEPLLQLQSLRIAVHEPASGLLFMSSLIVLAYFRRRRLSN